MLDFYFGMWVTLFLHFNIILTVPYLPVPKKTSSIDSISGFQILKLLLVSISFGRELLPCSLCLRVDFLVFMVTYIELISVYIFIIILLFLQWNRLVHCIRVFLEGTLGACLLVVEKGHISEVRFLHLRHVRVLNFMVLVVGLFHSCRISRIFFRIILLWLFELLTRSHLNLVLLNRSELIFFHNLLRVVVGFWKLSLWTVFKCHFPFMNFYISLLSNVFLLHFT